MVPMAPCWDHPDFSLVPFGLPPKGDLTPVSYRGMAHTREGLKALLALGGRPVDNGAFPFSVFVWKATPTAVHTLHTQYPEAQATPLFTNEACLARTTRQEAHAWLTAPQTEETHSFTVTHTGTGATHTAQLTLKPGVFVSHLTLDEGGKSVVLAPLNLSRFWCDPSDDEPMTWVARIPSALRDTPTPPYYEMDAPQAHQAITRCLSGAFPPAHLERCFGGHPMGKAYQNAQTQVPTDACCLITAPWAQPTNRRFFQAFFEKKGIESRNRGPHTLFDLPLAHAPLLREVAKAYDEKTQDAAFQRHGLLERAPLVVVKACPGVVTRALLSSGPDVTTPPHGGWPSSAPFNTLRQGLLEAFQHDDREFIQAVQKACGVNQGEALTMERIRPALCATPVALGEVSWEGVYLALDRYSGFTEWAHPEGRARFVRTFEATDGVEWTRPLAQGLLSPDMIQAFSDPAFLKALDDTPFWSLLAQKTHIHPEWQAVVDHHALTPFVFDSDFELKPQKPRSTSS
jgi:hypothetical protein